MTDESTNSSAAGRLGLDTLRLAGTALACGRASCAGETSTSGREVTYAELAEMARGGPVACRCGHVIDHPALRRARALATRTHAGQTDKAGRPYIDHPRAVVARLREAHADVDALTLGWLHDTVEDTDVTLEEIRASFGVLIADAVDAISRRPGERPEPYIDRVRANDLATTVKRADIWHNSRVDRLALLDSATAARLRLKYARDLSRLIST